MKIVTRTGGFAGMSGGWVGACVLVAVSVASSPRALAQPPMTIPEVEGASGNNTRATANEATLRNQDSIRGLTRGTVVTGNSDTTADMWLLTIPSDPTKLLRHSLLISTTGTAGHTGALLGSLVSATSTIFENIPVQLTSVNALPARTNVFYTYGQSMPRVVYRITGTSSTSSNYLVTLSTTEETLTTLPDAVLPVTISTAIAGQSTNTEIHVYDPSTQQLLMSSDDVVGSSAARVTIDRPGRYLVIVSVADLMDNRPPADGTLPTQSQVLEFPGVLAASTASNIVPMSFTVTSQALGQGTGTITATTNANRPSAYRVNAYVLTVQCSWADVGSQGGTSGPDFRLDNNDFAVFAAAVASNNLAIADVGIQGGLGGRDGLLNQNDFVVFTGMFFEDAASCNP